MKKANGKKCIGSPFKVLANTSGEEVYKDFDDALDGIRITYMSVNSDRDTMDVSISNEKDGEHIVRYRIHSRNP